MFVPSKAQRQRGKVLLPRELDGLSFPQPNSLSWTLPLGLVVGIQYRSGVSKEALSRLGLDLLLFETEAFVLWLLGISSSQAAQASGGSVVVLQPTCLPQAQLTPLSVGL